MNRVQYSHNPIFGLKHHQLEEDQLYDIVRPGFKIYTVGLYKGVNKGQLKFYNNRPATHTTYYVKPTDEMRFILKKPGDRWINLTGGTRKRKTLKITRVSRYVKQ
jgi:hypothetical protein